MAQTGQTVSFLGMPAVIASAPMRRLLDTVQRAAVSEASVLITGESGSGKEMIARAVHQFSLRSSRPWVDVSCGALPEHLVESELFGYEKGAFSGADTSKPGLFELAHQGTLMLDEVGELEPRMQVKLLRVLDNAPYYRLGGLKKISVDVRLVTATNRDLIRASAEGRFREDLYHRIAQINIHIPPLRERRDDILPIAQMFLSQQNPSKELSPDAMTALVNYRWPGNVRELRNVILKCAVLSVGDVIEVSDLPPEVTIGRPAHVSHMGSMNSMSSSFTSGLLNLNEGIQSSIQEDEPALAGMEREMIIRALSRTGGHQQRAADLLGISRRTLSRRLKMYGEQLASPEKEVPLP